MGVDDAVDCEIRSTEMEQLGIHKDNNNKSRKRGTITKGKTQVCVRSADTPQRQADGPDGAGAT